MQVVVLDCQGIQFSASHPADAILVPGCTKRLRIETFVAQFAD
jgi:hypothetical protein